MTERMIVGICLNLLIVVGLVVAALVRVLAGPTRLVEPCLSQDDNTPG